MARFNAASATGRATPASLTPDELEVDFVFLPDGEEAGGPGPHHYKPWRNPNRPGTPLAFWREVKDALRRLVTGHDKRGSYIAPGPHGRRNNIEPEVRPSRAQGHETHRTQVAEEHPEAAPDSTQSPSVTQLDSLVLRRAQLQMPPWPPFTQRKPFPVAIVPKTPVFRGQEIKPNKPIAYKQQLLFFGGTDTFVSRPAAARVMSDLLTLMRQNPTVHVQIVGNAASDIEDRLNHMYYGSNAAKLRRFPLYGYDEHNNPQYGTYYGAKYRTIGDLMIARARAIGSLLISQGIPASRVHCSIGTLSHGTLEVPGSGALKRRATIVITNRQ